ncbi:MAG: hypothetical protein JJU42_02125 [Rhodobacteraceae bacterium]|nr:hypothetical protein [Paracoccaceae bacterium]
MVTLILWVHVAFGFIALAAAGLALGSAKGGGLHRRAGMAYVGAMCAVSATALALVALRPNAFLLAVAVFSFFLVFTGWRAGSLRDGRPRAADHAMGALMVPAGLAMLGAGAAGLASAGAGGAQPVILLVFGAIGLTMALADWRDWRAGPVAGKDRIARHLTRMLAGTIATITAAVTVNLAFLPELVAWLGPTALLTPVIFWWNARILRGRAA